MYQERSSRRNGYENEDLGYSKRSSKNDAVFIFYFIIITHISLTPMRISFQTRSQPSESQEQMVQMVKISKIMKTCQNQQRSSTTSLTSKSLTKRIMILPSQK